MHSLQTTNIAGASAFSDRLQFWLLQPAFVPLCIAVAICLRLTVAMLFPLEPHSDSAWYVARAYDLLAGLGYQESGHPTAYWPVGWPAILAGALYLFGSIKGSIISINLFGSALIMGSILWFGRNIAKSEMVARIALLGYAIYPNHIAYTGNAATEIFYTGISMLAFALLISGRSKTKLLIASGIIFGVATLIKPQTIAFPFGAVIALGFTIPNYRWYSVLRAGITVYIVLLCVVLPWSFRNQAVFGEFILVSTNGGTALILGANDQITGDHFDYELTPVFAQIGIPWSQRVERQVELNRKQKEIAKEWIRKNPGEYFTWMPRKLLRLWVKDTDGLWAFDKTYPHAIKAVRAVQITNQAYYAVVMLLGLICAFFALSAIFVRDITRIQLGLLFCMPVLVSLLAAVFTGQIRYHFPAMPYIFVAAAWTIVHFLNTKQYSNSASPSKTN